jgi:tRNA pseudouridine38-40 synthase
MKIVLNISYLGTNYAGFQVQPNAITVQERLQDAVERLFGYRCPLTGCSRTDSGVHAGMFVCTIDTEGAPNSPPIEKVADALNHYLPDDISVNEAKVAPDDFHPRYDVKSKEYCYVIWNARPKNPFLSHRALHWPTPLDEGLMNEAAEHFVGEHDFAAFCAAGSSVSSTVRQIYSASVVRDGNRIIFSVEGNGFLYNMVRIMVGTLINVSAGKYSPSDIPSIIESKDRALAGFTAPPDGLYLHKVNY